MELHAADVLLVTGLNYKQLDHALRTGVMRSRGGGQSGLPRRFGLYDLVAFALLYNVLQAGIPARAVGSALRFVQRVKSGQSLEQLRNTLIWTDGRTARLLRMGQTVPKTHRAVSYMLDLEAALRRVQGRLTTHSHVG
jgi:hypothetical protein